MEDLPSTVLLEILCKLEDSTSLARCRLASKTLKSLSYEVRSINIMCSLDRYLKSRNPETKNLITPFKSIVKDLVTQLENLEDLSIGVENSFREKCDEDGDIELNDLHLTDEAFVAQWISTVCHRLKSLTILDFWIQSCWRRSEILGLISDCCHVLGYLEVKNSWLSVESLRTMPSLTSLTLEFVRLDDEDLDKLNNCYPSLQNLKLIGVGGLQNPKIQFSQLKTCHWKVSNVPYSLTLDTPLLEDLRLKCVRPNILVIRAPLISTFNLSIEKANPCFQVQSFTNLKSLAIKSSDLQSILGLFTDSLTVQNLAIELSKSSEVCNLKEVISFTEFVNTFPCLRTLRFGHRVWLYFKEIFGFKVLNSSIPNWGNLKNIMIQISEMNRDATFSSISSLLRHCPELCDVVMYAHGELGDSVKTHLMAQCMTNLPRVRWQWIV